MNQAMARACSALCMLLLAGSLRAAEEPAAHIFRVKRQELYEFARQPVVTRAGDRITIEFESKACCDVTVAIEDSDGRILRHLAAGVLGPKAPEPFQKDVLKQVLVWDGKDDQERYVENKDVCNVRISLGLKPQFERTLFWSPHKRIGRNHPVFAPTEEGMLIAEGHGVDAVRLFGHDGSYLRTIYPFPAEQLGRVKGLNWQEFPQDGQKLPVKNGPKHRSTLLTSGNNVEGGLGKHGCAATALAVAGPRVALASLKLNRLAADGSTGGLDLEGPATGIQLEDPRVMAQPYSMCFSPDGKWVYLACYHFAVRRPQDFLHCVMRLDYAGGGKLELFAGSTKPDDSGSANSKFCCPTSVACDAQGRVFVADYMNDRIQIFAADGKYLQSVKVPKPVQVNVHPKTGEMYVGSWMLDNKHIPSQQTRIEAMLYRLGPPETPKTIASYPLPLVDYVGVMSETQGAEYRMSVSFHTQPPTVWLVPGKPFTVGGWGVIMDRADLKGTGIALLREHEGKLKLLRDFNADTVQAVVRAAPPKYVRQRMYVHPVSGKVFIAEGDSGVGKSFKQLVELDPKTGAARLVDLPMTAEDMAIDLDGWFYLRSDVAVGRFHPETWREIPYDYGEELDKTGFDPTVRTVNLISGLPLPATGRPGWFHLGGMAVSPKGNLVVTCRNLETAVKSEPGSENHYARQGFLGQRVSKYKPPLYPGRAVGWETHIWDKRGKLVAQDVLPGLLVSDGIALDKDNNIYVLASALRMLDGKPYFLPWTETLLKTRPGHFKAYSDGATLVALTPDLKPKRSPDVRIWGGGDAWLEGAEWMYGGVGFLGASSGGSCICWNARFTLDLFARSFVPEPDHFSIAVLDTNGNLILRLGRYGNVDDGKPLVAEGGPANARAIGGDEVALFHAPYVAAHSDRRLYISDGGNSRILSVKLDYHREHKIALKDIKSSE